jgi:hypothetical protein
VRRRGNYAYMRRWKLSLAAALFAATIVLAFPSAGLSQSSDPPEQTALSPYWWPAVSQWEHIILPYAQERELDPDLVAAVVWKESLGRPRAHSVVGAVGLMGLMPFEWRPSVRELENPWTNVSWGARALAHTIRDGDGDLYYSLAAYNGGWAQIHLRVTRNYATEVLGHYVRAVAARYGLPADGDWFAILSVEGTLGPCTITVVGPQRPLARYTRRPWAQADIPTVPTGIPPHATAITFVDERGVECRVSVWLATENSSPLTLPTTQIASFQEGTDRQAAEVQTPTPTPIPTATSIPVPPSPTVTPTPPPPTVTPTPLPVQPATPTPTPSSTPIAPARVSADGAEIRPGADMWWYPHQTLPGETGLELRGYDPDFPDWVYVQTTDGASSGWVQITDLELNQDLTNLPRITPAPTLTPTPPTPSPTPTPVVECRGGPLRLSTWDVEKVHTTDGWTATIFAQGHGGNCLYTYAWEGENKGGPTPGPVTFEISHSDPNAVIVGTVSVTSAGETVTEGLFIRPADDD